jgi:hypothetical protein
MRLVALDLLVAAGVLAQLAAGPRTPQAQRLWVVREPGALVEYSLETFAALGAVDVPRRVVQHPEYLRVSATGQLLFVPATQQPEGGGEADWPARRAWCWDGRRASEPTLDHVTTRATRAGATTTTETVAQPFLSAVGDSLVWFENRFEKILSAPGIDRSVRVSASTWRAAGEAGRQLIASVPAGGSCDCATGACEETCAEWELWAPDGSVGEFFLLTRFVPGQLGPTYQESRLYRRSGEKWVPTVLPQPIERALAASRSGRTLVTAVLDGGCCGWSNEGNDQVLVWRNGKASVVFDERARFANPNYDVSFYAADARLAPGESLLAYTLVSTARTAGEIRLSSEGKVNTEEAARVGRALDRLPAVEVAQVKGDSRLLAVVPRAELVGWLSDSELLLVQDGQLVIYDNGGARRKETRIPARSAAQAFLR